MSLIPWALTALRAVLAPLLVFKLSGWVVGLALVWDLGSEIETIFILLILPGWKANIPTLWHAYRLRKLELGAKL